MEDHRTQVPRSSNRHFKPFFVYLHDLLDPWTKNVIRPFSNLSTLDANPSTRKHDDVHVKRKLTYIIGFYLWHQKKLTECLTRKNTDVGELLRIDV